MILSQSKEDKIYNALVIGMALEDAYIYAGLTPKEIEEVAEDIEHQLKWKQITKEFEYTLLGRVVEISRKQAKMGNERATTWMLEHMFPRYSGKPQNEGGEVHLHFGDTDPSAYDTVEIFKGSPVPNTTPATVTRPITGVDGTGHCPPDWNTTVTGM